MGKHDDINARLEKLESYVYNELDKLLGDILENKKDEESHDSGLLRFKPSKHRKAYRPDRNFKKRCYTR